MKAVVFLATAAATVALLGSAALHNGSQSRANAELDRIIGDGGFNRVYPIDQASHDVQKQQYTARLQKIVDLLGSRDVSDMPEELRAERARNLQRLVEYRQRGVFPVNYDHPGAFLPCFIDSTGAICAAGYLVEQSAGRDLAEAINREYKYATIAQIDSPLLDRWIAQSGFSRAEIATIQGPSLSPRQESISIARGQSEQRSRNANPRTRRAAMAIVDSSTVVVPTDAGYGVERAIEPAPTSDEPAISLPTPAPTADPVIGEAPVQRRDMRAGSMMLVSR
jgi:hypothetical protein